MAKEKKEKRKEGKKAKARKSKPKKKQKTSVEKTKKAFVKEKKKSKKKAVKIPLYFGILLLILGFVTAYALFLFFSLDSGTGNEKETIEEEKLKVTLIYPKECEICSKSHTFIALLQGNSIDFELQEFGTENAKAKALIEEFEIKEVPVLLIKKSDLKKKMLVQTRKSGMQPLKDVLDFYTTISPVREFKEHYVIPEIGLSNISTINLILGESCGSKDQIEVYLFQDPYCPFCIASIPDLRDLNGNFQANTSFTYKYLKTQKNSEESAKYFLCAQEQGKLRKFEDAFYGIYCDHTEDRKANDTELRMCKVMNPRWGKTLDLNELSEAVETAGLDANALEECLTTADEKIQLDKELADSFNASSTPLAVVNCKYKAHVQHLEDIFCYINPELPACS